MQEVTCQSAQIQTLSQTSGAAARRRRAEKGQSRYTEAGVVTRDKRQRLRAERQVVVKLEWLIEYKLTHGCTDCGYSAHPTALDFDHLPGSEKRDTVAHLTYQTSVGLAVLQAEVAKCELVCSNCHRIRHFNRRREVKP